MSLEEPVPTGDGPMQIAWGTNKNYKNSTGQNVSCGRKHIFVDNLKGEWYDVGIVVQIASLLPLDFIEIGRIAVTAL